MGKKFVLSFSGGKDSMLSLYRMIQKGWEPVALLCTYNKGGQRTWFHGIPEPLLRRLADAMGIPLCLAVCGEQDDYTAMFRDRLLEWKAKGAEAVVFGDIDLQGHRDWCESCCAAVGMEAVLPLWKEDREALVYEFLDAGFTTLMKTVRLAELDESFLGKPLSRALVQEIKAKGADACGENGEYHTLVVNGPIFRHPVSYTIHGTSTDGKYAFLDIE